jgi:hypothetical protein
MTSIKHHYLPEFFLKGFTDESGTFFIYDHYRNVLKNRKFYPSSHFFEKERNTIEINNLKDDFPEQVYSLKDNIYSILFSKIQTSSNIPKLSIEQILSLQEFVTNLFWRLPENDSLFLEQFKRNTIFKNSYVFKNQTTGQIIDNEQTRALLNSDAFKRSLRPMVSTIAMLKNKMTDVENWRISYAPGNFNICSDNPIILKDSTSIDLFTSDLIMPLTKNHLLIRSLKPIPHKILEPEFTLKISLLVFMQGTRYSASPNKDYFQMLSRISKQFTVDNLKKSIFSYLN